MKSRNQGFLYNNHACYNMSIIEVNRLLSQPVGKASLHKCNVQGLSVNILNLLQNYLPAGPIIASMVPAATAVPITPATLGPMACISRKLEGLAF